MRGGVEWRQEEIANIKIILQSFSVQCNLKYKNAQTKLYKMQISRSSRCTHICSNPVWMILPLEYNETLSFTLFRSSYQDEDQICLVIWWWRGLCSTVMPAWMVWRHQKSRPSCQPSPGPYPQHTTLPFHTRLDFFIPPSYAIQYPSIPYRIIPNLISSLLTEWYFETNRLV